MRYRWFSPPGLFSWRTLFGVAALCLSILPGQAASFENVANWPGFAAYQPLDSFPTEQAIYVVSWSTLAVVAPGQGGHRVAQVKSLPLDRCHRLHAIGQNRLLVTSYSGFVLVDISDALNPAILGRYTAESFGIYLGSIGNIAYYNNMTKEVVEVIDCADPANPRLLGTIPGNLLGTIVGDKAFGNVVTGEFQVWQLTEQTNRTVLGTLSGSRNTRRAYVSGSTVYLLSGNLAQGIEAIDISDPANPKTTGQIVTGGDIYDLAIQGDTGWITDWNHGLVKVNLRDLTVSTEPLATFGPTPESVRYFQNSLYVVDATAWSLPIISLADGAARETERVRLAQPSSRISLHEHVAAISGGTSLALASVLTPKHVKELGRVDLEGTIWVHVQAGNLVYANAHPNLAVINIADPGSPKIVYRSPSAEPLSPWYTAFVAGKALYTGSFEGLTVFDISEPARPSKVATHALGPIQSIHRNGNYLYVSATDRVPDVLDMTDPLHPARVGELDLRGISPGSWSGFAQEGSLVVVSMNRLSGSSSAELLFFDVAQPDKPRLIGWGPTVRVQSDMMLRMGTLYYLSSSRILAFELSGLNPATIREPQPIEVPLITELVDFNRSFLNFALFRGSLLITEGSPGVSTWSAHLPPKLRVRARGNALDFEGQIDPAFVYGFATAMRIDGAWESMGLLTGDSLTLPISPGEAMRFYSLYPAGPAGETFP